MLRMKNVSDKSYGESNNTHFLFSKISLFFKKNRASFQIMWGKKLEPVRPQMTT